MKKIKKLKKKIEDLKMQLAIEKTVTENWSKARKDSALQLVSDVQKIIGAVAMAKDLCDYEETKAARMILDDIDESLQTLSERYKFDIRTQLY